MKKVLRVKHIKTLIRNVLDLTIVQVFFFKFIFCITLSSLFCCATRKRKTANNGNNKRILVHENYYIYREGIATQQKTWGGIQSDLSSWMQFSFEKELERLWWCNWRRFRSLSAGKVKNCHFLSHPNCTSPSHVVNRRSFFSALELSMQYKWMSFWVIWYQGCATLDSDLCNLCREISDAEIDLIGIQCTIIIPTCCGKVEGKRFRVNWCHHHQSISTCKFSLSNVLKVNSWTSPMQQQQQSSKRCDKMSKEWALIEMFTREMQTKHARVRTNFNSEGLFGVRLGWRWEMRYVNYVNDKITEMHTKWEEIFLD